MSKPFMYLRILFYFVSYTIIITPFCSWAGPVYTDFSVDTGTLNTPDYLDANGENFRFTDDANVLNNVVIDNFSSDDIIQVINADDGCYSFSNDGEDVIIIYNNNGIINKLELRGAVESTDLVYDEVSFEDNIGFDAFKLEDDTVSNVIISAVIKTVEAGNINAIWEKGGEDKTSRGDRVVWGYFYADPNEVSWGSINNPEVFVKVWYDVGGRVDVNFFHVSVPDIEVAATYNGVNLNATATTTTRYICHYYNDNNSNGTSENTEDGIPVAGYNPANNPYSYPTINNLDIGAMINTVEAVGSIDAVWILGGTDTTSRGDQVVWGHFYADPNKVSWGSMSNPELFVKIWFDAGGRIDVNFFHVSVPEIEVYSDYGSDGIYDTKGTTIMNDRYIRHEYAN